MLEEINSKFSWPLVVLKNNNIIDVIKDNAGNLNNANAFDVLYNCNCGLKVNMVTVSGME